MQVKIQKWGNSQGIRIPKHVLDEMKLGEGDQVKLELLQGKIVIEKETKKRRTIEEIFEGYDGDYQPVEFDWGPPVGREVW